jgi:Cu(I)/Ag(I) efflux system membrane protein CusA/SilA
VIASAVGETTLTTMIEGRRRFPVRVRYAPEHRADPQALDAVLIASPGGAQIPLGQIARISHGRGPAMISSENGLLLATVLLNVQGRDVGGLVDEARAAVAREVTLPPGYFIGWSGRWENQAHARERLQLVLPIVVLVIFGLLYLTYRSAIDAAHVLLAVPFALTGGVYLIWVLGYNFSVAVWVGFIALFGTAVQTGVVMVIYLEDAVARKRQQLGGAMTRAALREAVIDGALLRLRPKVMTVSTVVAALLPIMWSTRVGAEVMKPLAAPVLGGMVSSLLHVLVVTPVIFYALHARRVDGRDHDDVSLARAATTGRRPARSRVWAAAGSFVLIAAGALALWQVIAGDRTSSQGAGTVVTTVRDATVDISLLSPTGTLRTGRNTFTLEFRDSTTGALVDAGAVAASAQMVMPGMAMSGNLRVAPTAAAGRYEGTAEFGMAGAWDVTVQWDGPAGRRSVAFQGDVR